MVTVAGKGSIGRQKRLAVGHRQTGSEDRLGKTDLVLRGEGSEPVGEGHGKPSRIDGFAQRLLQVFCQGVAFAGPGTLTAQELGRRSQGEAVVVNQRSNDPGLVHGRERFAGGIGLKQEDLGVAVYRFDHYREFFLSGVLGGAQSLESVDHFKAPWHLRRGDHAKR